MAGLLLGVRARPPQRWLGAGRRGEGTFQVLERVRPTVGGISADGRLFTVDIQGELHAWRPGSTEGHRLARRPGHRHGAHLRTGHALGGHRDPRKGYAALEPAPRDRRGQLAPPRRARRQPDVTSRWRAISPRPAPTGPHSCGSWRRGEPACSRGARQQAHLVRFSPDDRQLAVASFNGTLRVFSWRRSSTASCQRIPLPHASLVLSSNGQRVASLSEQGRCGCWMPPRARLPPGGSAASPRAHAGLLPGQPMAGRGRTR